MCELAPGSPWKAIFLVLGMTWWFATLDGDARNTTLSSREGGDLVNAAEIRSAPAVATGSLRVAHDHRGDGGDVDRRIGERREHGAHARRRDRRYVALEIDDDLGLAAEGSQRFVDAGGAVEMIGAGHCRFAAGDFDRRG